MKKEDLKIIMIKSASKALDYRKINMKIKIEDILQKILNGIEDDETAKIVAVASATKALKYQDSGKLGDKQILQKILSESDEILFSLDINFK